MRMEKRKFRIGELAEHLAVERFVIRFWEKEFNVKSTRSTGGQRFYNEDDARTFAIIKDLLYNRGFTIAGARKELPNLRGARLLTTQSMADAKQATAVPKTNTAHHLHTYTKTFKKIREELIALRAFIEAI